MVPNSKSFCPFFTLRNTDPDFIYKGKINQFGGKFAKPIKYRTRLIYYNLF